MRRYRARPIRHSGCATVGKGDRCGPLRYYARIDLDPDIVPPFSKKPLKTRLEAPRGYASYCSAVAAANSASFRALLAAEFLPGIPYAFSFLYKIKFILY